MGSRRAPPATRRRTLRSASAGALRYGRARRDRLGRLGAGHGFQVERPHSTPDRAPAPRGSIAAALSRSTRASSPGSRAWRGARSTRGSRSPEGRGAAYAIEPAGPCARQAGRKARQSRSDRACGAGPGDGEQGVVPMIAERARPAPRPGLAPPVQLPQRGQLSRRQRLRPFHAEKRVRVSPSPFLLPSVGAPALVHRRSSSRVNSSSAQASRPSSVSLVRKPLAQRRQVRRVRPRSRGIAGSGARDQSAFWCSLASFTPAYFSKSAKGRRPAHRPAGGGMRVSTQSPRAETVVAIQNPAS